MARGQSPSSGTLAKSKQSVAKPASKDPANVLKPPPPPPTTTLRSDLTPELLTGGKATKSNLDDPESSDPYAYFSKIGSSEHDQSENKRKGS